MHERTALTRWLWTALATLLLAVGCAAGVLLFYGGGTWQPAAQLEASRLAQVEVTELVGSTDYVRSPRAPSRSLWTRVADALRLPLANPAGMLEANLPLTQPVSAPVYGGQSAFWRSLQQWDRQTNKMVLGWIPYDTPAHTLEILRDNPGVNVICPGWLTLANTHGQVQNRIQPEVVRYAHSQHIQVWALFDNRFDASLTHAVLSDPVARRTLVQQVTALVRDNQLDGINLDFENVRTADRTALTDLVSALHNALAPLHAHLSVDVTPDVAFLRDDEAFFHAGLAAACDYLVVMAYDEHWGGDPEPGPVADLPWVTEAVDDLLDTGVPADQLLLGLPFYTELWHVHRDDSVTSQPVATASIPVLLQQHQAHSQWDDELGVAYAEYPVADGKIRVWYETDETLARKLQLVSDRGLAGVAVWSLSLSDSHTWSTVVQALRQSVS
ncbi:MAG: glycoside hydrolase [Alicyclobacillus sp.]|nr:glycoside hydrolase [Alicyclobacillus sp.]